MADQDLAGEGETDAGATAFGGEEGHENLLANGGGDRLAVVADIECLLPAEVNRAGSRLDGVLNEVDQGLPQQVLVGAERDGGWDGDVVAYLGRGFLSLKLEVLRNGTDDSTGKDNVVAAHACAAKQRDAVHQFVAVAYNDIFIDVAERAYFAIFADDGLFVYESQRAYLTHVAGVWFCDDAFRCNLKAT